MLVTLMMKDFLHHIRGTRYHLSEWREGCAPINYEEYFNMKHAFARNVIERCFRLLKMRWTILRSPSLYPIKTQIRIIIACCLLHNLIRKKMSIDHVEIEYNVNASAEDVRDDEFVGSVNSLDEWNTWRDNLAKQMFNEWRARRDH